MSGSKRIRLELEEVREALTNFKQFRNLEVNELNILNWEGLIVPENEPYKFGAFKVEINFPIEFPFQPPKVFFKTKIYHPNVGAQGEVCLPILDTDKWQQDTKILFVIIALVNLVNNPEPLNYLRKGIAIEFLNEYEAFLENAGNFTIENTEPRPKK